ncbi:MAG: glycine--tRNA ligase [Candidatus Babeliales bacterium]
MHSAQTVTLEKIISLCKRKGFVYQAADIYGGLNGIYDFGHLGTLLKQNIRATWLDAVYKANDNIFLLEGSLLGHEAVWKASGHLDGFHDPMVDCMACKHRYRADEINLEKACPHCGKKEWTDIRTFNMMFKTQIGASEAHAAQGYLRPETAQSIFVNFKNVIATNRVKMPFGIAQIGKAFRNEINPKQFLFRMREFEQMELEWFCKKEDAEKFFEFWSEKQLAYHVSIGIKPENLRIRAYDKSELAHYAQATNDIEYQFPFGWKELEGVANRTDFDLSAHSKHSGKELSFFDEETKESYIPTVIESSVGVDRLFLTILFDAYEEQMVDGELRTVLHLNPRIAPIKAAFLPLVKKLNDPMYALFSALKKKGYSVIFDDAGSIGKRYRRQDEIGTPVCFTYDFESETDNMVTVRDRDTMEQKRIAIDQVEAYIENLLQ